MSEKKQKEARNTINVPIYDVKKQFEYVIHFCKPFDFDPQLMLSLILAEWIYIVEKGLCKDIDSKEIFISYLESAQRTRKDFKKLQKIIDEKIKEVQKNG